MESQEVVPQDLPAVAHRNHGRTLAGWVTNGGIALGALVAALGMSLSTYPAIWAGAAVVLLSLAAGAALRALGHGQTS